MSGAAELWVLLAVGAALAQTTRNALTQSVSAKVSPALNSWARFAFCLPWAGLAALAYAHFEGQPELPAAFFAFCLATALSQLLGAVALIAAFRAGSFGEAIVFHKLEVLLTAGAGALLFAELPSLTGWAGIAVCLLGVIAINLARKADPGTPRAEWRRAFRFGEAARWALLCAVLLSLASFALKEANALVHSANPALSASGFGAPIQTLFHTTWIEVLLLSLWIAFREPGSFGQIPQHAPRMALIGATGFAASLCWFWAFSLTLVAYVKAVGQIEALLAVGLGIRFLGEEELRRQLPGVLLVMLGIVFVLVG